VDIIYRELQESFPLADPGVIQQIENSLTRPRLREIDNMETSISIKNKLVGIINELENELRGFERECGSFYFDSFAYGRYKHNAVTLLQKEYDFLFDGTCLQAKVSEINDEHRRIERTHSTNTNTLKRIFESFKSGRVISHFKERAEREFFTKVDQIIGEYQKYLTEFLRMYEEKWAVEVQTEGAPAFVSVPLTVEVSITAQELPGIEEELTSPQSDTGLDIDYLFPSELESGNEDSEDSMGLKEEEQNPRYVTKLTVTYNNGETKEFSLSSDREELQGELERLLLEI
jgi:hypothetical protein